MLGAGLYTKLKTVWFVRFSSTVEESSGSCVNWVRPKKLPSSEIGPIKFLNNNVNKPELKTTLLINWTNQNSGILMTNWLAKAVA